MVHHHRRAGAVAVLFLPAFVCSCAPDVKAPNTPAEDALPADSYPQIVVLDGLEQSLVKRAPVVTPATDSQSMVVRVPVRSIAEKPVSIRYRFSFFAPDGTSPGDDTTWSSATIPPRAERVLQDRSISLTATIWRLEIRKY